MSTTAVEEGGQPWLFFYLVRPEELPDVVTRHVPAQNYWTIDVIRSPVIELNRSFFDGQILRRGRLYYTDSFYDEHDALAYKSEPFRAWAKSVVARVKRTLKRQGGDYVGPIAEALVAVGEARLES